MSESKETGEDPKPSFEQKLGKASGIIGLIGLPVSILTIGTQLETWVKVAAAAFAIFAILFYFYAGSPRLKQLGRRLDSVLNGASRWDLAVDLLRLVGFFILVTDPIREKQRLELFGVQGGVTFGFAILLIILHPIYRFFRGPGMWDDEFKLRKSMVATAISCASATLEEKDNKEKNNEYNIYRIELNALMAVKSYLEYSVTERNKTIFNANLLVKDPKDTSKWLCIQRSNTYKAVPKRYNEEDMRDATTAYETRLPRYISDNRKLKSPLYEEKDYRMVWLIPIRDHDEGEKIIGLLAIDSLKPGHLDLEDNRKSLLLNLRPFIALLRFALVLRRIENVWP